MPKEEEKKQFSSSMLKEKDRKQFEFVTGRILDLQQSRTNHYNTNLDVLWAEADRAYVPHRLKTKAKRAVVTDEDKGWRGALVDLGSRDWQSDISQANPFIKIQTALSILVDQNPSGVFTPASKRFTAINELMKQLYQRSWEKAGSKSQLELFIHNLAKYGWAIARTYPLRIARKVRILKEYDQEEPDNSVYEEKEVVEFNDIMRENIDPRNAWIDDMARPNNPLSLRDWCWRKVYDMDVAKEEFGKYKNWKYVEAGGTITETVTSYKNTGKTLSVNNKLVEILFYENKLKDLFMVIANGVPVIIEPLAVSDANGNKKLSLWQSFWNLRHAESLYGIGIYEAIRYDQAMLDRVRNMSIDQLTLSIYKMFFYQGTQSLTETGDIEIAPGRGKQVLDPKNISWLQVPGPGNEAWEGLDRFRKDVDEASGVGDPLLGNVTGKTAFEIAQAREAALKRLKTPLNNILQALDQEGYITVSLIQLLYSIPEVYKIVDQPLIDNYLKEIQSDPQLFERDEEGNFNALVFPEFPLNLDQDEEGNLVETKETQFFRIKPAFLKWDGMINIKAQSLLTPSKQIDKALDLEMYNMLIPLLANDPMQYSKIAKSIVKLYDKDPKDILPENWLQEQIAGQVPPGLESILGGLGDASQQGQGAQPQTSAPLFVSRTSAPQNPQSIAGQLSSRLSAPARAV